jgi:16S rRNA (cytosine1402-N4)-methyltransferase
MTEGEEKKLQTEYQHKTVMAEEAVELLVWNSSGIYVDATFGGGGHSLKILSKFEKARVIAIDWDSATRKVAERFAERFGDRFLFFWGNYTSIYKYLKKAKIKSIDGIIADLGSSQNQLMRSDGFSFLKESKLDMRMSKSHSHRTAAEILNRCSERELSQIFFNFGEETQAKKIAHAIVERRRQKKFDTTTDLSDFISTLFPERKVKWKIDPATKVFQALRIEVNNEMEVFELVTRIFEKAIKNGFDVKIYSGSCALGGDYFTPKQICRMTEGGKRLSKHPKEKYEEIINRMKSILKERGELLKMAREYINRVSVKELEQDLIECGVYEIEPSPCQIHKF